MKILFFLNKEELERAVSENISSTFFEKFGIDPKVFKMHIRIVARNTTFPLNDFNPHIQWIEIFEKEYGLVPNDILCIDTHLKAQNIIAGNSLNIEGQTIIHDCRSISVETGELLIVAALPFDQSAFLDLFLGNLMIELRKINRKKFLEISEFVKSKELELREKQRESYLLCQKCISEITDFPKRACGYFTFSNPEIRLIQVLFYIFNPKSQELKELEKFIWFNELQTWLKKEKLI